MYKKYANSDCLENHQIHYMRDFLNGCKEWCSNNKNCGGFTRRYSNCYFKSYACGHNILEKEHVAVYIKQGRSEDIAPEVKFRKHIMHTSSPSVNKEEPTRHQKSKKRVSLAPQKGLMSFKTFFKKKTRYIMPEQEILTLSVSCHSKKWEVSMIGAMDLVLPMRVFAQC